MIHKYLNYILVLFLALFLAATPATAQVGSGVGNYDIAGNVVLHGNVTVADANDLTVTDDVAVTDDIVTVDIYSTGEVGASRQTTVTVTSGGTIPTTSSFVPLAGAYSSVGTSTVSGCTAGATYSKVVTLYNTGTNSVVLTDTSTLKLSGNVTLGQTDTVVLRCDTGTGNWLQIATSNN